MKFSDYPVRAKIRHQMLLQNNDNVHQPSADRFRDSVEFVWVSNKRPYYSVYPGIIDPLLNVKLDIPLESLSWPIENQVPILIRLDDSREGLRSMLCGISDGQWFTCCYRVQGGKSYMHMSVIEKNAKTIEEDLSARELGPMAAWAKESLKLAIAICLLGNDSEFIQPEVLTADQIKFGTSRDMKLVEKAKKRGKYGWTVGREIDCLPHIRRPHFAIRWTGKGGSVPKVVPVKGSVVKRKSMADVPTGYMDEESE